MEDLDVDELKPVFYYNKGGSKHLYFYYPKTREMFSLTNNRLHWRLKLFGTFRPIYVNRDELRLVGVKIEDCIKLN